MSSDPFTAAAPPQATMSSADPTAVFGRRIGAWIIDFLLYMLIMAFVGPTPLSPLAEYVDTNDFPGVDCTVVQDANDVSGCLELARQDLLDPAPPAHQRDPLRRVLGGVRVVDQPAARRAA